MSATATEPILDADLAAEVPCQHSQHATRHLDGPAKYLVRCLALCDCEPAHTYALCEFGWYWLGTSPVSCWSCLRSWDRDEVLQIVQVLR